jgi:hypothetical protein
MLQFVATKAHFSYGTYSIYCKFAASPVASQEGYGASSAKGDIVAPPVRAYKKVVAPTAAQRASEASSAIVIPWRPLGEASVSA